MSKTISVIGLSLLICIGVVGGVSVAVAQENEKAVKETVAVIVAEKWLATVDEGKYGDSWKEAALYFRNAISKEQWEKSLQAVRTPLGKMKSRQVQSKSYSTSLPGAPDGEYVVILFKTTFENKASAIETVTPMLDKDGKWRVSGYFIR